MYKTVSIFQNCSLCSLGFDDHKFKEFQALLLDPEEMDVEDFSRIPEIPDVLLILCMATYGEGDPTDNAQEFYQHIADTDIDLRGIKFAVGFLKVLNDCF